RFERGLALYDAGDFAAALAEFEAAERAVPSYRVWANIGLCEKRLFRYGAAVRDLRRYLDDGGARIPPPQRAIVEKGLAGNRSVVAQVVVQVTGAPARVEVDGAEQTLAGPLLLAPGRHVIVASREGEDADRREIQVNAEQRLEVTLSPRPRPRDASLVIV